MSNLKVVFTLVNDTNKIIDQAATLIDINENEIMIRSKENLAEMTKAFVALCYGKAAKIFFSLNTLTEVKKDGAYYIYKFDAPKEKEKKNKRVNLNIDGCYGYSKLLCMMKPKRTKKGAIL